MTKDGKEVVTLKFKFAKDTPNTYRMQEVGEDGLPVTAATGAWIGPLYLRKDKWASKPETITLEVKVI